MQFYADPWPHVVIDDYYEESVFKDIQREMKNFLKENVNPQTRKQAFEAPENETLVESINTRPLTSAYFDTFTQHRQYEDLELYWEVNFLMGPLEYPIHDESSRKVLSSVVYVDPVANSGTTLYDKDKNFAKKVEWKPNRAFIFAAIDGVTWHSYDCPSGSYRTTINQFLCRPRDYNESAA